MTRVATVKMPWLLAFARHMETTIIEAQKPRSAILMRSLALLVTIVLWKIWRRAHFAMPKTICAPD